MSRLLRLRVLIPLLVLIIAGAAAAVVLTSENEPEHEGARAAACGGREAGESEAERERENGEESEGGEDAEREREREQAGRTTDPRYQGPPEQEGRCEKFGGPENFADLARANSSLATRSLAPGTSLKPGAFRSAVRAAGEIGSTGGSWAAYGGTPLQGNLTDYDTTNGSTRQGLPGLAGRTTSLVAGAGGDLYAGASNGGVWKSTDKAATWTSVSDAMPTQVVGGLAWSSANGGTLLALTGDDAFGGNSNPGLGVYYTRDGGTTWKHASGVPDGVLGFKLAVDPANPSRVYAATGAGLFRSTDGGETFANVSLPVGDCAGKAPSVKGCFLANMVTDVVVQPAGGPASTKGGAVMAAVGWRAGTKENPDGSVQSPGNGIYTSATGEPGSFKNADFAGHAVPVPPFGVDALTQARIGRIELGIANGAAQDHNIVYAIVQDAVKFNGGVVGIDANENGLTSAVQSDVLNGIWVSSDFGASWRQLEGSTALDTDTTSGSALAPPTCKTPAVVAYCPGVQAWYNEWVQPDPTQQTAAGVPTRVLFGLEEIWANRSALTPPTGLDGTVSTQFEVIGRYYADESCTLLNATNGLPICPTTVATTGGQPSKTTTHPDQHTSLFVPDADGKGSTLYVGNDGGVFSQHAGAGESFGQLKWGNGNNTGLHTLQPYDVAMANDGTAYMGLQDNGEAKIEPSGKSYTIFGGDGFFTAVDPKDSNVAYEEYVGGVMSKTTDGGKTWTDIDPGLTSAQFGTPFEMDDRDAGHLLIGGRDIQETTNGGTWAKVYDLGTQKHPGDAAAAAADDDPDNQLSAVDVQGAPAPKDPRTGPPTKDIAYTGGATTVPGPGNDITGQDIPVSYEDHPFTIGPDDGDASLKTSVSWSTPGADWDTYLFRKAADGTLTKVGTGAGSANPETITLSNPESGDYVLRVYNYTAFGTYDAKITFAGGESSGAGGDYPSAAYVGFCGYCDVITQGLPFANGIATNVGGDKPGKVNSGDGWHIAAAKGLPSRYITSVRMDPANTRTVFVTLGGYGRRWAQPGALGDDTSKVGTGHVFRSDDAGATFRDVSANLPDVPANWSALHDGHLLVATDLGVFESSDAAGGEYKRLGRNLPSSPVFTLRFKPDNPDCLVAASFGRGAYTYRFGGSDGTCGTITGASTGGTGINKSSSGSSASSCFAAIRQRRARAVGRSKGRLRLTVPKSAKGSSVDVFQVSKGRRIFRERLIARFTGRKAPFTWNGKATNKSRKVTDGYYFARVKGPSGAYLARLVLERRKGKWHPRQDFYLRGSCGPLVSAKYQRPVFGGRQVYPLRFSYRLKSAARVRLVFRRGNKVVRSYGTHGRKGNHTYRIRIKAKSLPKGLYVATLRVGSGKGTVTTSFASRRI
ncbi:MAG: hypothetical protein ACJ762_03470 [Solirubrobacteraceae bacterium]